jgi:hypothetical protein
VIRRCEAPSPTMSLAQSIMVTIDRARVDDHLVRPGRLAQQFATPRAHVAAEHRVAILRDPHEMVLAVPDRVAAALVAFHAGILRRSTSMPRPPKGVGFPDPLSGTLKLRLWAMSPAVISRDHEIPAAPPRDRRVDLNDKRLA